MLLNCIWKILLLNIYNVQNKLKGGSRRFSGIYNANTPLFLISSSMDVHFTQGKTQKANQKFHLQIENAFKQWNFNIVFSHTVIHSTSTIININNGISKICFYILTLKFHVNSSNNWEEKHSFVIKFHKIIFNSQNICLLVKPVILMEGMGINTWPLWGINAAIFARSR